jgi:hypothetical protein
MEIWRFRVRDLYGVFLALAYPPMMACIFEFAALRVLMEMSRPIPSKS